MEVKTILDKIRQKENQPSEYYFALEIGLEFIKSAVFSIIDNQVKVLSLGSVERWESDEELIEAVDASLSSAAEKLPVEGEVAEPDKVVFGLPFNWVEGEKIIDEKLKILKELSEKLDLKPAGFVVISEAIVHQFKTTEGVPPTAILVNLGTRKISLALVRIGKITGPELVEKSPNLADDLIEGLSRFENKEPLPARILLYDGEEELEEAKQQLINYPWLEKKKEMVEFLHLPKVETLSLNFDIEAIALAGGKEVAKAAGLVLEEKPAPEKKEVGTEEGKGGEPELAEEEKIEETAENLGFASASSLGFVGGKEVKEGPLVAKDKDTLPSVPPEPEEGESLQTEPHLVQEEPVVKGISGGEGPKKDKLAIFSQLKSLPAFFSGLREFNFGFLKTLIPVSFRQSPLFLIVGGFFLIFIFSLLAAYWFLPRAEVTLYLEPEVLAKDFTITLDPNVETPDKEELILPARQAEVEVEDTKSRGTTGSADVGDAAKGEVTLYNGTSNQKTFDSGTSLASAGGLEFTLDDEVTVASQSSAADPPGQAKVKVTAAVIGTEGNLASGTEFTIANYAKSDYVAKNDSAFSGGTSRQVQAVSDDDQKILLTELKTSLEEEAKKKLITQISSEERLVEESFAVKTTSADYSHEVGEEVDNLELTLKMKATAMAYNEKELRELTEESVLKSISAEFEYNPEETEFTFDLGEMKKDGSVTVEAHLEAKLLFKLDVEKIKKDLAGKYLLVGRTYLGSLPRTTGFEAKIVPQLPGRLGTFPRRANRIEIKTEVK
ncbi:MAG: baseplate J/gp47 family protein [Candidatus Marinimicrobia bacterium]|nr:baseplate J/gp47 family protein [Candidatus Neomarinimicrobiota bacterium]